MVIKTIVKAFCKDGKLVGEFEWDHKEKRPLKVFLELHSLLHPFGAVECYNERLPNDVVLEPCEIKDLF